MTAPKTLEILQATVVDLIDLTLGAKQAHWNVHGPNFRSVHLELDEVEATLRDFTDEVAERLAAVGGSPDGRAETVAETSQVEKLEAGAVAADKVVYMFADRLAAAARRIEDSLTDLDADMPSQDILTGIVSGLDKAAWMFRSQEK